QTEGLSRLAASFVLGYHGCDADTARKVINGEEVLRPSDKKYDWLGPGAYFWESDPRRAMEWAVEAKGRGRIEAPAISVSRIKSGMTNFGSDRVTPAAAPSPAPAPPPPRP